MARRSDLTRKQNDHVREVLTQWMQEQRAHGVNQVTLAPRLGLTQSALSRFLDPEQQVGLGEATVRRLARVMDRPVWDLLGEAPPELSLPPRTLAVQLVAQFGVSKEVIREVLDRPKTPENESWCALVWANHILALHFGRAAENAAAVSATSLETQPECEAS